METLRDLTNSMLEKLAANNQKIKFNVLNTKPLEGSAFHEYEDLYNRAAMLRLGGNATLIGVPLAAAAIGSATDNLAPALGAGLLAAPVVSYPLFSKSKELSDEFTKLDPDTKVKDYDKYVRAGIMTPTRYKYVTGGGEAEYKKYKANFVDKDGYFIN